MRALALVMLGQFDGSVPVTRQLRCWPMDNIAENTSAHWSACLKDEVQHGICKKIYAKDLVLEVLQAKANL